MMPSVRDEELERVDDLGVGDRLVAGPTDVGEVGVLGPDAGIVEPRRDRLGLEHLTEFVLHEVGHDCRGRTPGTPRSDRGAAGGLDPDQLGVGVGEAGEDARGVASRRRRRP